MGNRDDAAESTPSGKLRSGQDEICEYCGSAIDTSEWYPVSKQRDSDGTLELLPFCSEDCQQEWQSEQASDD